MVICHRRKDKRPGSYSRNRWSVSFEEQYNPIEQQVGNTTLKQDSSIEGSLERGVREELLGDNYTGIIKISVHAFLLETKILNYASLAVVELPNMDFDTLKECWAGARDHEEHDALVAIPLQQDILKECLNSPRLPESVFPQLQKSPGFDALEKDDHLWHPTSLIRIALGIWISQQT